MVNYQNGKIYKIESLEGKCMYIGSTCQKLSMRMASHRKDMKKNKSVTSKEVLKYDDAKIYLIVNHPCNNKEELLREEGKYIKQYECVNKCIAGRTIKEYREDNKEYYDIKKKEWYLDNKQRVIQMKKEHYNENKEYILEYHKKHYTENKEKIKEYQKENNKIKTECICGSVLRKSRMARHNKSIKHIKFITKE